MLLINQQVDYDFANKETIYIDSFKYKQGEVDGNGIDLTLKNISPKPNTFFLVNWLYRDQYDYVYIPNLSTEVQGDKVVVYPPQAVLRPGVVGFEIIAVEIENGVPVGQLIGPTIIVPVAPSLVSDGDAVIEDADISKTVEIISDQTELKNALEALNSWLTGKENARKTEETRRQNLASQKAGELDTAKSNLDTAIASANSATSNANAKAALADTAATNANTAATNANASATATNTSATNANTAKSNADAKKTLADTAKTNADGKKTLADQKKALADTAKSNADTKKAAADANAVILEGAPAEVTAARVAGNGTTHDSLKKSLDANFVELSSRIPTNVGVSGIENVTVNNSLAGEVSGVELTGRTLVNLVKVPLKNASKNLTVGTNGIIRITDTNKAMFVAGKTYTVMAKVIFTKKPEETSSTAYAYPEFVISKAGGGYQYVRPIDATKLAIKDTPINTPVSNVSKFVLDPTYDGSVFYEDISAVHVTVAGLFEATCETIVLEGDHTDKPLSFFEGLKSAELETVTSRGVNLFDGEWIDNSYLSLTQDSSWGTLVTTSGHKVAKNFIPVTVGKTYKFASHAIIFGYDNNFKTISNLGNSHTDTVIPQGVKYIRFYTTDTNTINHKGVAEKVFVGLLPLPYQSSTTSLPSPITLRSLPNGVADTYDFDTQTLTRRCGEVVLNGSEIYWGVSTHTVNSNLLVFRSNTLGLQPPTIAGNYNFNAQISNNFATSGYNSITDADIGDGFGANGGEVKIVISKSKLTTPDVAGFKAWLQANPTTVVYQLATPTTEIVENSGLLRSYDNQTTIYADSVVPCDIKANVPISFKSAINSIAQTNLSIEQPSLLEVQTQQEQNADELTALQLAIVDLYEERI